MRVSPWRLWAALKASLLAGSWAGMVGSSSQAAISSVVAWMKQSSQVARLFFFGAHGWAEGSAEDGAVIRRGRRCRWSRSRTGQGSSLANSSKRMVCS